MGYHRRSNSRVPATTRSTTAPGPSTAGSRGSRQTSRARTSSRASVRWRQGDVVRCSVRRRPALQTPHWTPRPLPRPRRPAPEVSAGGNGRYDRPVKTRRQRNGIPTWTLVLIALFVVLPIAGLVAQHLVGTTSPLRMPVEFGAVIAFMVAEKIANRGKQAPLS